MLLTREVNLILDNQNQYRITMLPVADGDCFFLEFKHDNGMFNILIDCGPISTWETSLKVFLDNLIATGKRIDLLLITHIDGDHIGGALKLFGNHTYSGLIKEVWFNGLQQVAIHDAAEATVLENKAFRKLNAMHWHGTQDIEGPISATQAESLATLLKKRGLVVNGFIDGAAICNTLSTIQVSPGFFIDILLPTQEALSKLKTKFHIKMNQAVFGTSVAITPDGETAFENVLLDEDTCIERIEPISESKVDIKDIKKWAITSFSNDSSITNASSIAICIRYHGKKFLFPGDATQNDLTNALNDWMQRFCEDGCFEVIKLPHHGSGHNCMKLFDLVDSRVFLISTDGCRFDHPNKETIAKIVTRPASFQRTLFFNYQNTVYKLFRNDWAESKYSYRTLLQTDSIDDGGDLS